MLEFRPGQRWFSSAEPELGLGTVLRLSGRQVQIVFTGSGMLRHYAIGSAPLLRAAFRPGDRVQIDGVGKIVERFEVEGGLVRYHCGSECYAEGELDAEQPVSQADARLLAGRLDRNDRFELRREMLERRGEGAGEPCMGRSRRTHRPDRASIARRRSRGRAADPKRFCLPMKSDWARPSNPA